MYTIKEKYLVILCILIIFSLVGCYSNKILKTNETKILDDAKFLVVQSFMFKNRSFVSYLDNNGNILRTIRLKAQDLSLAAVDKNTYYLAGARANDNIIISEKLDFDSFNLLGNKNYSGSTAIALKDNITYSSMNGNVSEKYGYVSLLVARDRTTKEELYKTEVPLFTTDMLVLEDQIFLVGTNAGYGTESAVLCIINRKTGEILSNKIFDNYREFFSIKGDNSDLIYISGTDKKTLREQLVVLDDVLNIKPFKWDRNIINGHLIVYRQDTIVMVDEENMMIIMDIKGNEIDKIKINQGLFFNNAVSIQSELYVYFRSDESIEKAEKKGKVFVYDLDSKKLISEINVKLDKRTGYITVLPLVNRDKGCLQ